MKIKHKEDYRPLRQGKYPAIGEQLDAIYKGFEALQMQGFLLPEETVAWLEQIKGVKSTFKKG